MYVIRLIFIVVLFLLFSTYVNARTFDYNGVVYTTSDTPSGSCPDELSGTPGTDGFCSAESCGDCYYNQPGVNGYIYTAPSFPATCLDNILSGDETGIDCGGSCLDSCEVIEPLTCADGVLSGDETGIDCGDSACVGDETCTTYCPSGFNSETRSPDYLVVCYADDSNTTYTTPAVLGECPSGMFKSSTNSDLCVSWSMATFASGDYLDPIEEPEEDTTPWNNVFTQDNTSITSSTDTVDGVTTDIITETTTGTSDDGSERETVKEVTEVTQADGSKTVTTVTTDNAKDTSGGVTGYTLTETESFDSTGTLTGSTSTRENIESSEGLSVIFSTPGDGAEYIVDGQKGGQFATRLTDFKTSVSAAPFMTPINSLFAGPDTSTKSPSFTLSMGSYGTKNFSLSNYDDVFDAIGLIFVFMSCLAASRMVMVKGAG